MHNVTADLLLYAKAFCLTAEEEFERGKRVSGMLAIMHMQDAIEFCMNAILRENGIPQSGSDKFGDLRKAVNDHFKSASPPKVLPLAPQMDFLNTMRGKIKHHASVPSVQDAERCLQDGRAFLERVYLDYFGEDFAAFSLSALVESEPIRTFLQDAERHVAQGNGEEALVCVAQAFRLAQPQQGLLNEADFTQFLLETGTDFQRLHRVRANLPWLIPIADAEDNDASRPRQTPRRVHIMAHNSLDTSLRAVEATLHGAVELILHWQSVGIVGWQHEKSYEEGTLRFIRTEPLA